MDGLEWIILDVIDMGEQAWSDYQDRYYSLISCKKHIYGITDEIMAIYKEGNATAFYNYVMQREHSTRKDDQAYLDCMYQKINCCYEYVLNKYRPVEVKHNDGQER